MRCASLRYYVFMEYMVSDITMSTLRNRIPITFDYYEKAFSSPTPVLVSRVEKMLSLDLPDHHTYLCIYMYISQHERAGFSPGRTHGAPYRGYGYVPLRFGGGTSSGEWEHNHNRLVLVVIVSTCHEGPGKRSVGLKKLIGHEPNSFIPRDQNIRIQCVLSWKEWYQNAVEDCSVACKCARKSKK